MHTHIFDRNNTSRTETNNFYDKCLTESIDGAKCVSIFASTEEKFTKDFFKCHGQKAQFHNLTILKYSFVNVPAICHIFQQVTLTMHLVKP